MCIVNDAYHIRMYERTNVPTPPALCLGTPVPRQNPRHYPEMACQRWPI